jgi:peptide/nickel transport system substrate-binding protein
MNTSIPPFDDADARRAVNFAIDRAAIAESLAPDALTCQLLPPGFPGYQPYCPYTFHPDAGGLWKAPDMQTAQRLIDESGTRGADVTLGPRLAFGDDLFKRVERILQELGYRVTLDERAFSDFPDESPKWDVGKSQIRVIGWSPDYLAPGTYLGLFRCPQPGESMTNYCDPDFDRAFDHAQELQASDPAAALAEWASLERRAVDLALLAPLVTAGGRSFVSERVGNYQYSAALGPLYDQMWVQ